MPCPPRPPLSRRDFLAGAGACGAHLLWMSAASSLGARRLFAAESRGKVVAEEPWGRLEELYDGVWAVVSTPLAANDWTTLANGGILAGKERVLVVESFARSDGAAWVARKAHELTGRWPTDVVLTHYHGDHANGVAGFEREGDRPHVWMTSATAAQIQQGRAENAGRSDDDTRNAMVDHSARLAEDQVTEIDLGGLKVQIHPRSGHTGSDLTIELEDPSVVFYGDLLWNRMFPNYRDTTPTVFAASIRAAMRQRETVYVPGHGSLAGKTDVDRLLEVLEAVEDVARKTWGSEMSVSEVANHFKLPASLGEWTLFSDNYFEVAISAWYRELAKAAG